MEIFKITNEEQVVRLVGDGAPAMMLAREAQERAEEQGLDLIYINTSNDTANVKIGDFKKLVFDTKKREKARVKKQMENKPDTKEVRVTAGTSDHDIKTKAKQIDKFLKHGDTVTVAVVFKGRALRFMDSGFEKIDTVLNEITEDYRVKRDKKIEGNKVNIIIAKK